MLRFFQVLRDEIYHSLERYRDDDSTIRSNRSIINALPVYIERYVVITVAANHTYKFL